MSKSVRASFSLFKLRCKPPVITATGTDVMKFSIRKLPDMTTHWNRW